MDSQRVNYFLLPFWLSLAALFLIILIYKYFHLPLSSIGGVKGLGMYFLVIICFSVIIYFYHLIVKTKEWLSLRELLKQIFKLIIEFNIKIIPFFIFLYIYDSIHDITHLINPFEFDKILIKIDRFILGGNDLALLLEKIVTPWLTGILSIAYLFYFIFYLINPIAYFLIKERRVFDLVLSAVIITNFLGLAGYLIVPCLGPVLAQQDLFSKKLMMPSGEVYQESGDLAAAYVYSRGSFHCFPSLHFGVTFIWLYAGWQYLRKEKYLKYLYYLHIPAVLSLWLATVYLRWHYLVDWLGGLLVALLGIWLAKRLINWWYKRGLKISHDV